MPLTYEALARLLRRAWASIIGHGTGRWLVLAGAVGALCGVVGFIFELGINLTSALFLDRIAGVRLHLEGPWVPTASSVSYQPLLVPVVMILGGCLSGWLSGRFARDAAGGGTGVAVQAFHRRRGLISLRTTLTKLAASVATLGSGGSAGREGPIALVGAGFGSWFATRLGLTVRDRRVLLVAGTAGGIAAVFHAPLAAAIFAAEVLYRGPELEADVLIPSFIASITGFVVGGLLTGAWNGSCGHPSLLTASLFSVPAGLGFSSSGWRQLAGYLLVAVALAFTGRLFIAVYKWLGERFTRHVASHVVRGLVGAALAGSLFLVLVYVLPALPGCDRSAALALLGPGYGIVQDALDHWQPEWTWAVVLAVVALVKVLATAVTVGSGCSGGIFAPCLVIGGCVGGAVGTALQGTPIGPPPAACVLIGMAGLLGATHRTPVAALLMVSEIAGTYSLLIPAMWVVGTTFLLMGNRTAIPQQVKSPWDSPAHQAHAFHDVFSSATISEALDHTVPVEHLAPASTLEDCRRLVSASSQSVFPVVSEGKLVGLVSLDDLRALLYAHELDDLVCVADVADGPSLALRPDDTLARALRRFAQSRLDALPVVGADGVFLTLLPRQALFDHYQRELVRMSESSRAEGYETAMDWRRTTDGSGHSATSTSS